MNTDRIEALLEQLVSRQDEILHRLQHIELHIKEHSQISEDSNFKVTNIQDALTRGFSDSLADQMVNALGSIEKNTSGIDAQLNAHLHLSDDSNFKVTNIQNALTRGLGDSLADQLVNTLESIEENINDLR
jgi:hypothetical protein